MKKYKYSASSWKMSFHSASFHYTVDEKKTLTSGLSHCLCGVSCCPHVCEGLLRTPASSHVPGMCTLGSLQGLNVPGWVSGCVCECALWWTGVLSSEGVHLYPKLPGLAPATLNRKKWSGKGLSNLFSLVFLKFTSRFNTRSVGSLYWEVW